MYLHSCASPTPLLPTGDGHNDVFYVLGGLQGTVIRRFTVFDRWGQLVFQAQDSQPGDASLGWNGNYRGLRLAPRAPMYISSPLVWQTAPSTTIKGR